MDDEYAMEGRTCPYCSSAALCEHLLLLVDQTFRLAEAGPLMDAFNKRWNSMCDAGGDDFDEREPFDSLLELADSVSGCAIEYDFDGGPGASSAYVAYYVRDVNELPRAIASFEGSEWP
jgi:hypothetical protein